MGEKVFFDSWDALLRVAVLSTLAYATLVFLLRITGKRTLSKMNAFDLVITVALGSSFATVILSKQTAFAEGALAFTMLVMLQYAITWLSVRSALVRSAVKAEPRLLFHCGDFLRGAMRLERITKDEILAAVRNQGKASLEEVNSVILETDGTLSVTSRSSGGSSETAEQNVQ